MAERAGAEDPDVHRDGLYFERMSLEYDGREDESERSLVPGDALCNLVSVVVRVTLFGQW